MVVRGGKEKDDVERGRSRWFKSGVGGRQSRQNGGKHLITNKQGICLTLNEQNVHQLTLTVLVATIDAQWEGMEDVGSARYEPALLPPCPTIRVLSYSN